jgi:hypothetical protein
LAACSESNGNPAIKQGGTDHTIVWQGNHPENFNPPTLLSKSFIKNDKTPDPLAALNSQQEPFGVSEGPYLFNQIFTSIRLNFDG